MCFYKSPFPRYPLVELHLCRENVDGKFLIEWLCKTPTVTTYRVNLMLTTVEDFKKEIEILLRERYEKPPELFTLCQVPEILCLEAFQPSSPCTLNASHREVIVDNCCGSAVLRGAHIYAVGVLAMETATKRNEIVNVFADIEGNCRKGCNVRYGSEQKMFLGRGRILMTRNEIFTNEIKSGIAVEMLNTISNVPCMGNLSSAKALLQNLPSVVCVRVLNPQKGETILDMCAAPGNKTTHIAELMQDQGVIIALDKISKKISLLREKIEKEQIKSIKAFMYDATKAYDANSDCGGNGLQLQPPFKAQTFDRILLDAPCSALGQRPLLSSDITPKILHSYPKLQRKLWCSAVPLLKPGGCLVYSTCTVNVAENEEIVSWALQKFPELQLHEAQPMVGGKAWSCPNLTEQQSCMMQRFGPNATGPIDTVGFFIAKFMKKIE